MAESKGAHGEIMRLGGTPLPAKLRNDAIVEVIFEMRFDMLTIPEILIGRLADHEPWKGFTQRRLPAYEIPAPLRQADPNLRFQAVFELSSDERHVRIGPEVISYHRTAPYVGWQQFQPELNETIDALFHVADGLTIRRLGLRYLNALRSDPHRISSVSDLDLEIQVAGERLSGNVNLNFTTDVAPTGACTVRIATTEFIQGKLPPNTSVFVDVDVFTKDGFEAKQPPVVKEWLAAAHAAEKQHFFRLLTDQCVEALQED